MKAPRLILIPVLILGLWLGSVSSAEQKNSDKIPSNLQILRSLKSIWKGVACTGDLALEYGGDRILNAPIAVAYQDKALSWVAFITPPTPCAGTVVLGRTKVGLGNRPALEIGTPPGMVIGNQPSLLTWTQVEKKSEGSSADVGSLCGGGSAQSGSSSGMFSAFAGGLGHRPDSRSWDPENKNLLVLEGRTKETEGGESGRYSVWLDKSKGYLPLKSIRQPDVGPATQTLFQPREVAPGQWLPVRWEVSGPGRPTMIGEFINLKCNVKIPSEWFSAKSYPDVASEKVVIKAIQATP